jgi:hypothetical protein
MQARQGTAAFSLAYAQSSWKFASGLPFMVMDTEIFTSEPLDSSTGGELVAREEQNGSKRDMWLTAMISEIRERI